MFTINNLPHIFKLGQSIQSGKWRTKPRKLEINLLVFVYQGKCKFIISNTEYVLSTGDSIFVPANTLYVSEALGNEPCRFYFIQFSTCGAVRQVDETEVCNLVQEQWENLKNFNTKFVKEMPNSTFDNVILNIKTSLKDLKNEIFSLLDRSLNERNHLTINSTMLITLNVSYILSLMTRITISALKQEGIFSKRGELSLLVQEVMLYIQNNYFRNLKLSDICKQFDVSKQNLIKKFNNSLGISPVAYINRFRISQAKELMHSSTLTISEIASEVGIEDQNYFSRLFKKFEGVSPTEYKKMLDSKIDIGDVQKHEF